LATLADHYGRVSGRIAAQPHGCQARGPPARQPGRLRQAAKRLGIHRDAPKAAFGQWGLPALERRVGWQPSRFLADRAEAERAFALAERLGSINAAAQELGTTWPSLRKAFTRHGLGMPARNPEAVRERAAEAARQRSSRPATPSLDPVFVVLNHDELPVRARSGRELAERVRRAEDYAVLGARVVVELHSESHATSPAPAPGRSPAAPSARIGWPASAPAAPTAATPTEPTAPAGRTIPKSGRWWPMPADPHRPDQPDSEQRFHACVYLDVHSLWSQRRWVMSHLSTIPLGAHPSGTGPSTGALATHPPAAVPPGSWRCRLGS
jgi:hypothetical protein